MINFKRVRYLLMSAIVFITSYNFNINLNAESIENYNSLNMKQMAKEELETPVEDLGYDPEKMLIEYDGDSNTLINILENQDAEFVDDVYEFKDGRKIASIKKSEDITTSKAIELFEKYKTIKNANREIIFSICDDYTNDLYSSELYHLMPDDTELSIRGVDAYGAWEEIGAYRKNKVKVAVIDSGCDINHPDLVNVLNTDLSKEILMTSSDDSETFDVGELLGDSVGVEDKKNQELNNYQNANGHGTHVAGIIGAEANNEIGVAGTASFGDNSSIELVAIDALEGGNFGSGSYVAYAMDYACKIGCNVINMSLGATYDEKDEEVIILQNMCQDVYNRGVAIVCAAGNTSSDVKATDLQMPAVFESTIAVINTTKTGTVNSSSCYSSSYDVCAPGTGIMSTIPTTSSSSSYSSAYTKKTGTSMASPVVAGIVAMLYCINNTLTPSQVKEIVRNTATDLYTEGVDEKSAYGLANAKEAVIYTIKNYTTSEDPSGETNENTDIYRLYNKVSGEHLFTSKEKEYTKLAQQGWVQEGKSFIAYTEDNKPDDAVAIYRLFNPNGFNGRGDHHYTKSQGEIQKLVKAGWSIDFNGAAAFYVSGSIDVYKMYNSKTGAHHYTPKTGERDKMVIQGWKLEGIGWAVNGYYTNDGTRISE